MAPRATSTSSTRFRAGEWSMVALCIVIAVAVAFAAIVLWALVAAELGGRNGETTSVVLVLGAIGALLVGIPAGTIVGLLCGYGSVLTRHRDGA